ncbi:hypothetical protein MRB53_038618 [Persea americana]|nr:hypothetical protein MRB53_038618 [Persea americana]
MPSRSSRSARLLKTETLLQQEHFHGDNAVSKAAILGHLMSDLCKGHRVQANKRRQEAHDASGFRCCCMTFFPESESLLFLESALTSVRDTTQLHTCRLGPPMCLSYLVALCHTCRSRRRIFLFSDDGLEWRHTRPCDDAVGNLASRVIISFQEKRGVCLRSRVGICF